MVEKSERSLRTIDELLSECQASLKKCLEELNSNPSTEERQKLDKTKSDNEQKIYTLNCEKESLLQCPRFVFLLANEFDNKVLISVPTYIVTQEEAKYLAETTMENLLVNNNINLRNGSYVGIIVRKANYDKLSDSEKVDVQKIFHNNGVYITSKEIIVSSQGISII